jgi:hypothetical protein
MRNKGFVRYLLVALVAMALATVADAKPTEDTVAKCNDGRDNDRDGLIDDDDPDCAGLGGGGGEIPLPDNDAGWRGAVRDVDDLGLETTRVCINAAATPSGSDIAYECSDANEFPKVVIDLTGVPRQQTRRNGDPGLCDFFDGEVEFTPLTEYDFRILEPCPAGALACETRVNNWSFESSAAVARGVGLIVFHGFGDAIGASDNPNPFSEPQDLDIFELVASFKQLGANKTLAICRYEPVIGDVTFHTAPLP